jgi:hypothetical protein
MPMPTKIKGNIHVTDHLYQILEIISQKKKRQDNSGHLAKFERLIDPVILATFYGLYKSRELPPSQEDFPLEKSYEFNADISDFANKLNNFLFCLWVKQNGLPDNKTDIMKYREKLYEFTSRIISEKYFISVILPFYINKADEAEGENSSFLHRLWSSDNIGIVNEIYSPEFLAVEFDNSQADFIKEVIEDLSDQAPMSVIDQFLLKDEDQKTEFKSSLRYDVNATQYGQDKINPDLEKESLKEVCAFLNSDGGTLLIGVSDDKKVLGLKNDYRFLPKKQDKDGFERLLREKLTQSIQPDIPGLVNVNIEPYGDEEICLVTVGKSQEPMFLKEFLAGREFQEFWIRDGNRKRPLVGAAMADYIRSHWKKP